MAYTVPEGYAKFTTLDVPTSPTLSGVAAFPMIAGQSYHLVAKGTGSIQQQLGRGLDAEFVQKVAGGQWNDLKSTMDWGIGFASGKFSWGAYQSDHVYGKAFVSAGGTQTVQLKYFDDFYPDNAGTLTVGGNEGRERFVPQ